MVPDPLLMEQLWPVGWVRTETLYAVPLARGVVKAKEPLADKLRLLPLLFWSTTLPADKPLKEPPTA
jgi:hypothetical protein